MMLTWLKLLFFVRGLNEDFKYIEGNSSLVSLKDIGLMATLARFGLSLHNSPGFTAVLAIAMVGYREGLVNLIDHDAKKIGNTAVNNTIIYSLINQENLCFKSPRTKQS